ncbi:energy-coupling factor transporter transmembrane component T family protein [Treponema sp.]|uniref:energy-coupling factor transporter transmembrane component T family protein n=1 Tax=Treponema sp. TaxID=166 RepID=UPI003F03BF7E
MKGLVDFAPGNSVFHRMNPLAKLFFSAAICASCFVSSSPAVLLALLAVDITSGFLCGIPGRTFRLLRGLAKISLFLLIIQILLIRKGQVVADLYFLKITDEGLAVSVVLVLKLCCATLPLVLMLSVTKLADLSNALVEKLKVPYKYAFTLTTAIRFIPIFAQEMEGIQEAQTSRGIQLDTRNPLKKLALILPLCAPLLVSSVRKTNGTAIAADLRGFKLRTAKSCLKKYPFRARDYICFVFSIAMAVSVICMELKIF